jgi:hypothetical protein
MATHAGQTNTNLASALNNLDRSLQELKSADAWMDEVESLNATLGCESPIDRDLYKRVTSNAVTMYAQKVVDACRTD